MSEPRHSELLRKLLHVSMAGFALLLRWIPWWLGALLAAAALILNATLLPRMIGARLYRTGERDAIFRSGVVFYALSVLVLIVVFRNHLEVAACAWGVLALGDGASNLIGAGIGGAKLPWNPRKSWIGSAAFFVFGAMGGGGLMLWVGQRPEGPPVAPSAVFLLAGCAALVGAVVESLPLALDDNLSVPLLAGALVFSLQAVEPEVWRFSAPSLLENLQTGLVVSLVFALVARGLGSVSWSGVVGGVAVGTVIATFTGLTGFSILAIFFVLGTGATRLGYAEKARRGIAQEKEGARGLVHAVANCSAAAYLAFLSGSTLSPLREMLLLAFVASLATAACDTLGSEVGPLGRSEPFLITRLGRVPAGTPGAVSLLGTAAGAAAALVIGVAAAVLSLIPPVGVAIVVGAALFGTFLESLLAATLEVRGLIDSETVNFVNTVAGSLAALGLLRLTGGLA